jgi:dienelactone hydrolase
MQQRISQRWRLHRAMLPVASFVLVLALVSPLLAAESVSFPSALRQTAPVVHLSGYLYRPDGPGPFPAVVMLHACGGLMTRGGEIGARTRFWAEHLREHGYIALLVDSFTARGIDEVCTGRHSLSTVRERADDARGALQFLRQRADVQGDRVGLLGWSNGAAAVLSVLFDKGEPQRDFRAAIAFYPSCLRQYPGGPDYWPYAPLLVLIGAKDDWTPAAPCVQWTEWAQALGAAMRITVYPEAYHGFDAPDNPVHYRPEVRNRNKPGGCCGATVGTEPAARADAIRTVTQFFAVELGGRGVEQ